MIHPKMIDLGLQVWLDRQIQDGIQIGGAESGTDDLVIVHDGISSLDVVVVGDVGVGLNSGQASDLDLGHLAVGGAIQDIVQGIGIVATELEVILQLQGPVDIQRADLGDLVPGHGQSTGSIRVIPDIDRSAGGDRGITGSFLAAAGDGAVGGIDDQDQGRMEGSIQSLQVTIGLDHLDGVEDEAGQLIMTDLAGGVGEDHGLGDVLADLQRIGQPAVGGGKELVEQDAVFGRQRSFDGPGQLGEGLGAVADFDPTKRAVTDGQTSRDVFGVIDPIGRGIARHRGQQIGGVAFGSGTGHRIFSLMRAC